MVGISYADGMLIANELGNLWGRGAYTAPEASRLTGVPASRIHRWLEGRTRAYGDGPVFDRPLWTAELPALEDKLYLSFRDLIELRVVDRFRQAKISLPYLRKVVSSAQKILNDTHPFSNAKLKSDGRRIYLEIVSGTREPALIDVLSGQHAFHSIISEGLRDVAYDGDAAAYWTPEAGRGEVVVDPNRSFGQPVLIHSGVPTAILRLQSAAGRSAREISRAFEIDERSVRAALRFEAALAA
ncbi:MAG: hypothetical protein JWQ89_3592 [Devosia sp.]|uniref:DUF433 domain-containing protein n=1 Tax=Devosia sp. TaxID=1871048 RepID=UPI00261697BB|nr:DUF433 domain-containing protein [Devosia sp.]MDB5541865.1 hypothetical protein [Devosia sp.]